MSDPTSSKSDAMLDRLSKIAGVFLPVVVAVVGGIYTANKDENDRLALNAQNDRENTKKKI